MLVIFALCWGCVMAWAVGANDLANSMGSSVGAKSISIRTAVILAAVFEGSGSLLASGSVTSTLKESLFVMPVWEHMQQDLALGMLSALMASSLWLVIATYRAWPVSTTHTVVGAIIGFSLVSAGGTSLHWHMIVMIILSWCVTPAVAGLLSYFIFRSVQSRVFDAEEPLMEARLWLPLCATIMISLIVGMTLWGCLPKMGIHLSRTYGTAIFATLLILVLLLSAYWIHRVTQAERRYNYVQQIDKVERGFGALTVFTACAMAFSHGGNDISNALGPVAAIIDITQHGSIVQGQPLAYEVVILGSLCVVLGLAMYGYRIMNTVGCKITHLTPSRAFAAEFATALVVMSATVIGTPISTTQTLVGAILGVGAARGVSAINLDVVKTIILSWAFTFPLGGILSALIFYVLKVVWG